MLAIILAIIVLIVGVTASIILSKAWPSVIAMILAVLFFVLSCLAVVPTGFTGILTTFGRVEDRTINSGLNFIAPWSVNYCIDQSTAQKLYRTIGVNYYEAVMFPRIQENVKAVFSQYTAENLIAKRESLSESIKENTANDLSSFGITIVSIAIEDIDFTDAFTNAVEAKQVAAQNKLTAQTQQEQKTMEERAAAERAKIAAQADADKAIIAANADLEVVKVQAEAALYAGEREAEMNQRISKSLTNELVSYYWIKQWNGELPSTVLSEDGNYMISLNHDAEN